MKILSNPILPLLLLYLLYMFTHQLQYFYSPVTLQLERETWGWSGEDDSYEPHTAQCWNLLHTII